MSDTLPPLLPCPFCGQAHTMKLTTAQELAEEGEDDPEPWMHSDSFGVLCDASRPGGPGGCGASGGFFPSEREAVDAWNRRAALAAAVAEPVAWCSLTPAGAIGYFDGKPMVMPGKLGNEHHTTPLYAAPPQRELQWQPIETAPKDGRLFLCWVSAIRYGETEEGQRYTEDVSQVDFCNWRTQADIPDCGWFDPCCGQIGDQQGVTHWLPLPDAPASAPKEQP